MFFSRNTSSGHSRPEHISSYLNDPTLKRSTRKMSKDDSTYDTIFQTKNSHTLLIRVHIPQTNNHNSPCPAPLMTLVGIQASHAWLDPTSMKVIGYGPISSTTEFNSSKLLLSQVVNAVVQHFQLNPPGELRIIDESLKKMQPVGSIDENGYDISQQQHMQQTPQQQQIQQQQQVNDGGRNGWFSHNRHQNNIQNNAPTIPTTPKINEAEIHFSDVVVLTSSDKQYIQKMKDTKYVSPKRKQLICLGYWYRILTISNLIIMLHTKLLL